MKPTLSENYTAAGIVNPYRIIRLEGTGICEQADDGDEICFGVSDNIGANDGNRVDLYTEGEVEVEYGGTVGLGARVMPDANGKAITATAGKHALGFTTVAGVDGDIGKVHIDRTVI